MEEATIFSLNIEIFIAKVIVFCNKLTAKKAMLKLPGFPAAVIDKLFGS